MRFRALLVGAFCLLAPQIALAQSAIAGVIKDTSGAVLPGVTVEASSPALIEQVRSVTSDGQGVYRIVDLRPGTYTVTFSLPGFVTVVRDGITLPDAFTATVNADMSVGGLEETITVTSAAPLVDVQSVAQRAVLPNELTEALPSSRQVQNYVTYIPGATGTTLGVVGLDTRTIQIHGGRVGEFIIYVDGFSTDFMGGYGTVQSSFFLNQAVVQETNIQTAGAPPEQQFGGVAANIIPKEGGNNFSGYFFGSFANGSMQSDNLDDALRSTGLTSVNKLRVTYDINPAFGGAIAKNRVWFYSAARAFKIDRWRAGVYYNKTPLGWSYTPDFDRPANSAIRDYDYSLRLTIQANEKNRFNLFFDQQPHFVDHRNSDGNQPATHAPEATNSTAYWPNAFYNALWRSPVTSRLLLEAGANVYTTGINNRPSREADYGGDPFSVMSALDSDTNTCFRAACPQIGSSINYWQTPFNRSISSRASATYVTGSHSFKVGGQMVYGQVGADFASNDLAVMLRGGRPLTLYQFAKPRNYQRNAMETGLYVQDQWIRNRMSIHGGLRFDRQRGTVPANNLPAGRFVPARSFPKVDNVPLYNDISPRLGISYDLRGDGRTAIKGTANRYVVGGGTGIAGNNDPLALSVLQVNRTWTDNNGDFIPDCDLNSTAANGECGRSSNVNFGKANPADLGHAPSLLKGWGVRPYAWEYSLQLQRQLTNALSANVGYFFRTYGNQTTVRNLAVNPSDYSRYCVTVPNNPALPAGVGGREICGYDINPDKFGQVQNQTQSINNYGPRTENWRGIDTTFNMRLRSAMINGGVTTGRLHTIDCAVVNSPAGNNSAAASNQVEGYCDTLQPYQTQVKLLGQVPLPWWGIELSGVLQNVPGPMQSATAVFTNAQIRPSLGRDLAAGPNGSVTLAVIQPNTMNRSRQNQIDLRVAKSMRIGAARLRASIDLNNLANSNNVQRFNDRVSATNAWPVPQDVQPARSAAVNAQLTF